MKQLHMDIKESQGQKESVNCKQTNKKAEWLIARIEKKGGSDSKVGSRIQDILLVEYYNEWMINNHLLI